MCANQAIRWLNSHSQSGFIFFCVSMAIIRFLKHFFARNKNEGNFNSSRTPWRYGIKPREWQVHILHTIGMENGTPHAQEQPLPPPRFNCRKASHKCQGSNRTSVSGILLYEFIQSPAGFSSTLFCDLSNLKLGCGHCLIIFRLSLVYISVFTSCN